MSLTGLMKSTAGYMELAHKYVDRIEGARTGKEVVERRKPVVGSNARSASIKE